MRTKREIDAEIRQVKRAARLIVAALLEERETIPSQKPRLPPMTKSQFFRYKNATYHKGMTRDEAIAYALREPAAGAVSKRGSALQLDCGTSPAGASTHPAGALSCSRRDN